MVNDSPINLREPAALQNPDLLPQMRFLHHDADLLERTFELLLCGSRANNQGANDRNKMEQILEMLISKFYKLDFAKINQQSKKLRSATEEEIKLMLSASDYTQAKTQGFKFSRFHGSSQPPASEPQEPVKAREPAPKDSIRIMQEQSSILVPAYKPGYSLMYGTPHFYVQVKMIATIYERLVKAKSLIADETRAQLKLTEEEALAEFSNERFDMFVSTVLLTFGQQMPNERKLEQNSYEDLVRALMGKDAYLLFVFDRLLLLVS